MLWYILVDTIILQPISYWIQPEVDEAPPLQAADAPCASPLAAMPTSATGPHLKWTVWGWTHYGGTKYSQLSTGPTGLRILDSDCWKIFLEKDLDSDCWNLG